MTLLKHYFRTYRWQRWLLTLSVVAILACTLTILFYPAASDHWLIYRAGHAEPMEQLTFIKRLAGRARSSDATARRLVAKLDSQNDTTFQIAAASLTAAGQFDLASLTPEAVHRYWLMEMQHDRDPYVRYLTLHKACLALAPGDEYLRRMVTLASADENRDVRALSAVLAVKLGDGDTLQTLAQDDVPEVCAAAYRNGDFLGLQLRPWLIPANPDAPDPHNHPVLGLAAVPVTGDPEMEAVIDRHLASLGSELFDESSGYRTNLTSWIQQYTEVGQAPPAMLLIVGAEHDLPGTAELARQILRQAVSVDSPVTAPQVRAAIAAIDRLDAPARQELYDLIGAEWGPGREQEMCDAAAALGRQVAIEQDGPTREECALRLRAAARWSYVTPRQPGKPFEQLTTPLASASAALALWRIDPGDDTEAVLRDVARSDKTLPGDYLAWHIATEDPAYGMELGAKMIPRRGSRDRVFNDNERAAGAMMLALSARSDEDRTFAIERIMDRLEGPTGGEDNPYVRGAYHAALLILGEEQYRNEVRALLVLGSFPQRRSLTALLMTHDDEALKWLLWNSQVSERALLQLLAGRRIDEVLAATTSLPAVDLATPNIVRLDAILALQATYVINQPANMWTPTPSAPAPEEHSASDE